MPKQPAPGVEFLITESGVEIIDGDVGPEGSAHLHRLDRATRGRAAAQIIHHLVQGDAKGGLKQTSPRHVTCNLKGHGAARAPTTEIGIVLRAFLKNHRHRREADDVVHHRGPPKKAFERGQRWFGTDNAALAFERIQKRGFLAADIGAGAHTDFHVKRPARAQHIRAQYTCRARDFDCAAHHTDCIGVFRAQINIPACRADTEARNRHTLNQSKGVTLHDHPVREGAAVALIGIADDVFLRRLRLEHRLPFDAGRKSCAATPAKARLGDFCNDPGPVHLNGATQAHKPTMRLVIRDIQRVNDADAGKGEARLPLHPVQILNWA